MAERKKRILVVFSRMLTAFYSAAREYFENNKEDLKLKEGVRSVSAFIAFCIREYMKEKGII